MILKELLVSTAAAFPTRLGVRLRQIIYRNVLRKLGKGVQIFESVWICGFRHIDLGDEVIIFRNAALHAEEGNLSIGHHVGINTNAFIDASQGSIRIGEYCLIGPNCVLRAADHRFDQIDRPIRLQGHSRGEIILEDDVWLGANVVVLSGVRIGKGSVIGAQSVVTKDIAPYSVAVGNPARVIRSRQDALR
jgi:galactoside O-acetyltransferase